MINKNKHALVNNMGVKPYIINCRDDVPVGFLDLAKNIFKETRIIGKNLIRSFKNDCFYLEQKERVCPSCSSHNIQKNGTNDRTLAFKFLGKTKGRIQKYYCKNCGTHYIVDLSSIVMPYKQVTYELFFDIVDSYSLFASTLHKTTFYLKSAYNISISHQTVENVLLSLEKEIEFQPWTLSGYYLFDSLWVRSNGKWKYILTLFDAKLNTVVSIKLVKSEDEKTIYKFLNNALRNQKKHAITSDLKKEYKRPIEKIGAKHHYCIFHTKQKINRDICNYIRDNNPSDEEKEYIDCMKKEIFKIMDAKDIVTAETLRDKFWKFPKEKSPIIFKILRTFILPEFKCITRHINDKNIQKTNNMIENAFQKIFPKHIKRKYKTEYGIMTRFILKLSHWNKTNTIY